MALIRILVLADTHLGIDSPLRPRVERRRRGPDFFRNFEIALEPAMRSEVDAVVHCGDLLYRSRVPASLLDRSVMPLKQVADRDVPVFLVPGNHERSTIPYGLLASHPRLHIFQNPRTFFLRCGDLKVALAGFPYVRKDIRSRFPDILDLTGWRKFKDRCDALLLCVHHCFEAATVGPAGYMFRSAPDVIRHRDIPGEFTAVLSGHIHRHQILTRDLNLRPLAVPVLYPGSVERTSMAERKETKGFLILDISARRSEKAILRHVSFRPLPTRPMIQVSIDNRNLPPEALEAEIWNRLRRLPENGIIRIRIPHPLEKNQADVLRTAELRTVLPPTMNVEIAVQDKSRFLRSR